MPKFALRVKADLENVASIKWNPNNQWAITVQNGQTEEKCDAYFSKEDEMGLSGSKGTANFIKKWDMEMSQSYLKMIDVKGVTGASQITAGQHDVWVTLFAIECRGLEPVKWTPNKDFDVATPGGTVFKEVDIDEDGTWAEYDGDNECPVSIQNLTHEWYTC